MIGNCHIHYVLVKIKNNVSMQKQNVYTHLIEYYKYLSIQR